MLLIELDKDVSLGVGTKLDCDGLTGISDFDAGRPKGGPPHKQRRCIEDARALSACGFFVCAMSNAFEGPRNGPPAAEKDERPK